MLKHIDIYAELFLIKSMYQENDYNMYQTMATHFKARTSLSVTTEQFTKTLTRKYEPNNGQIVKALAALGLSNSRIAELLNLSTANVSFHKQSKLIKEYVNWEWRLLYSHQPPTGKAIDRPEIDYTFPSSLQPQNH